MILIPFIVLLFGIIVWMILTIILGAQIGSLMIKLIEKFKEEKPKKKKKLKGIKDNE